MSFFHVKSAAKPTAAAVAVAVAVADVDKTPQQFNSSLLHSEDPDIAAFYAQLTPKERIAHTIAIDKLGTSYDVVRTHSYTKWLKSRKE
jgi:hypothetical protein